MLVSQRRMLISPQPLGPQQSLSLGIRVKAVFLFYWFLKFEGHAGSNVDAGYSPTIGCDWVLNDYI